MLCDTYRSSSAQRLEDGWTDWQYKLVDQLVVWIRIEAWGKRPCSYTRGADSQYFNASFL